MIAPLRFAPEHPTPPDGPGRCRAPSCTTNNGTPRQGAQKCIEFKCKPCCLEAADSARAIGYYRDICKIHGAAGSQGYPSAVQRAPPAPAQLQPPPPAQPYPPSHLQPPRSQLLHPPVPPQPPAHYDPTLFLPAQPQPPQAPHAGTRLANPLNQTWRNTPSEQQTNVDSGKVARQKFDAAANLTVELAIFHTKGKPALHLHQRVPSLLQMQFSAHPALMNDLGITETTWLDLHVNGEWKTLQASTPFTVDKHHPSVIRIRPSLREELAIGDCPDLERIVSQLPRKRTGTALVSPPKKVARTDTISAPAQARNVIEILDDSPPSTLSMSLAAIPSTASTSAPRPGPTGNQYPWSFYVVEHREAWEHYNTLKDSDGRTSIPSVFSTLFPGATYRNTSVKLYRNKFLAAPTELVESFAAHGKTSRGSFRAFWEALQAHDRGEPLLLTAPNPAPLTSIKTETQETSTIPAAPAIAAPLNNSALDLCNHCDTPFPQVPSDDLLAMGEKLLVSSWPDPLPDNPRHRSLPTMRLAADYCARHRFEQEHLPAAIRGGWPFEPNFSCLFRRILDLGQPLRDMCKNLNQSQFFIAAKQHYGDKVGMCSSLMAQYSTNRSSLHGTGYYGERGFELLETTLRFMFPDSQDLVNKFLPLTYHIALWEILIPEAAIQLIQQDLDIGPEDAISILQQSHTFGLTLHPSKDDCEFLMAAVRLISKSHRRTQWSLRAYEASGSNLDFEAWLQNQRDMEELLAVKKETVEPSIPRSINLNADVIDLTADD
ncbi:hypothetical protein GGX14DRAFT_350635 [Mycena pura]|uniref:Restriction of telomere capping protein 4 n=1 Tax=Mycena pura TaxID=153505 RepID=A0AAD6YMW8_9AGAR|nr:hypothetical protein GGX14DRAFT_350635 [Mycena pura]